MATIKPTLTIVANSSDATNLPGPMSTALNLSTSQSVGVDYVYSDTATVTTNGAILFSGDTQSWKPTPLGGSGDAAGGKAGVGGFVYIKNVTYSGSGVIYVGVGADDDTAGGSGGDAHGSDIAAANQGDAFGDVDHDADDDGAPDANTEKQGATRFMTLERGEFAFFPWDYTTRIFVDTDANGSGDTIPKLEWWIFDRADYTLP